MNALKYYRLKAKLSQQQLANHLDRNRYTIVCWELGQVKISEDSAKEIGVFFESDYKIFVGRNPQVNDVIFPNAKRNKETKTTRMQQFFLTLKLKKV